MNVVLRSVHFSTMSAWINMTRNWGRLRKIRVFIHLLGNVVTPVESAGGTSVAHLDNRFPWIVYLNPVSNCLLHRWKIGIAMQSLCCNRLYTISHQEEVLSNFQPFLERCNGSSHAFLTHAHITFRTLGTNSGWIFAHVTSSWNVLCRWSPVLIDHSTISIDDIWIIIAEMKEDNERSLHHNT